MTFIFSTNFVLITSDEDNAHPARRTPDSWEQEAEQEHRQDAGILHRKQVGHASTVAEVARILNDDPIDDSTLGRTFG